MTGFLKHISAIWLLSLIASFFLSSCGSPGTENDNRTVFRYNQASGITSLDPAFAKDQANIWVVNQLYTGLVQFDEDLNIVPYAAKNWEISEDGLTYTFHLRDGIHFTDNACFPDGKGRIVNAEDWVYSFKRLMDPATASPGSWIFSGKLDESEPFSAPDKNTFVLKLNKPFGPLLGMLTMPYCFVVPKEAVEKYDRDFRVNPVGSGPFMLKSWKEGNVMVLTKNENYFETDDEGLGLPYLDAVKISFIDNKNTVFLKLKEEEIDFMSGLDPSYIDEILTKDGELNPELSDRIRMYKMPYLNTEYLGFLLEVPNDGSVNPVQELAIRQAINYGFDRDEMIQFLRNNIGTPAHSGFVAAGLPSFSEEEVPGYQYDPNKAKKLLSDAGFPGAKGIPQIVLYTNSSYLDLCTYIQKQVAEIGLNIKVETVPPAFQRELMAKGQAQFFRGSWIADYPDPESFLAVFYGGYGAPPNYTRFSNATFDSLYDVALAETDEQVRVDLYRQMDRIIVEQAPVVPLYYDQVLRFVNKRITGLEPNGMNLLVLKKVKIYEED